MPEAMDAETEGAAGAAFQPVDGGGPDSPEGDGAEDPQDSESPDGGAFGGGGGRGGAQARP